MEPVVLTVTETAEALKLSRSHVCRLADRGEIPSVKFGGRVLIPRRWVDEKIEAAITAWESRGGAA